MNTNANYSLLLIRIFSFVLMIVLSNILSESIYFTIFFTVLFAHYFLQFIFTRNAFKSLSLEIGMKNGVQSFILRMLFIGITFYLFLTSSYFEIPLTFGIHFVFTEVYAKDFFQKNFKLRMLHYLTSVSIYSIYLTNYSPFNLVPVKFFITFFVLALIGMLMATYNDNRKEVTKSISQLCYLIVYELIGFLFVYYAPIKYERSFNIIFYHLIWWGIYPFLFLKDSIRMPNDKIILRYVMTSILVTTIIALIFILNYDFYHYVRINGRVFGSMHIISSFFLSRQNPQWINKLFLKSE